VAVLRPSEETSLVNSCFTAATSLPILTLSKLVGFRIEPKRTRLEILMVFQVEPIEFLPHGKRTVKPKLIRTVIGNADRFLLIM
jgi:hypothetical protein